MKIYVTKYALTYGLEVHEAEKTISENMVVVRAKKSGQLNQYFHGKDWHTTKEAALSRAEDMRIKKLESLRKQIQKISELKFNITE